MKTLFTQTEAAYTPFFDTPISVRGKRAKGNGETENVTSTFYACVFDQGFATPFAEADADTTIHTFSIQIKAGDWLEKKPPQIGDEVSLGQMFECAPDAPAMRLVVCKVGNLIGSVWEVTAREVEND